ncbi:hypothetical protein LINGRAHAP2_LOCUS14361, partial [Linum grandiflorum]
SNRGEEAIRGFRVRFRSIFVELWASPEPLPNPPESGDGQPEILLCLGLMTMVGPKLVQPSSVRPFLNRFAISRGAHNFCI